MSGSEEGSWRAISWRYASRMKRNNQQRRLNDLDRRRVGQRRILSFQRNEAQRVNVEDTLVMIGLSSIGLRTLVNVSRGGVMLMMVIVAMRSGMVINVSVWRQRVNGSSMLLVNFMRVRLRGASRAGPHKRGSQNGRKKLTRMGHGRY